MTRKRPKDKRAIPEEILAEGSGPNEVVEADAQALADAASDVANKQRGRKAKQVVDAWGQPVGEVEEAGGEPTSDRPAEGVDAPTDTADDESVTAGGDKPARRGKRPRKARAKAAADNNLDSEATASAELSSADLSSAELSSDELSSDELSSDELSSDEPSDEAQAEQALEDAVLRAEAEAELGAGAPEADAVQLNAASDADVIGDLGAAGADVGEGADVDVTDGASADGAEADGTGAALPTTAANMDAGRLKNLVEALVFAADKPVTLQRLRRLTRVSDVKRLEQALADIAADYANRGIALQQVSGGYQFRTNTQYSVWVQQLIAGRPVRLSRAQLETLAIVAYRQPITRPEVDEIRGVDSSATLRLLLDRALIRVLGKREDVGRPVLYGTTKEFLDFFSLSELRELPTLREYSELTAESRKVINDRLGVDADGNAVDEDGNRVDADGNPIDDGTDVIPDLRTDSMDASIDLGDPGDPGAEDEAAVEAVSAVTAVLGIEEERIHTSLSDDVASTDESMAARSEDAASSVEAAGASDDAASSVEAAGASDDAASSDEAAGASDDAASSVEAAGASDDAPSISELAGVDDAPSMAEAAGASDDDSSMGEAPAMAEAAAASDNAAASGEVAAGGEVAAASDDAPSISGLAGAGDDQPLSVGRGAAQEDVIGLASEAADRADDSEDLAADDPSRVDSQVAAAEPESGTPAADLLDASASESLDETDKSPAE